MEGASPWKCPSFMHLKFGAIEQSDARTTRTFLVDRIDDANDAETRNPSSGGEGGRKYKPEK